MDLENLQSNMNTRVVFKEPRGMVRWLQLFFAIVAFSTVVDFYTTLGVDITCPPASTTTTTAPPNPNPNPPAPNPTPAPAPLQIKHPKLIISYPFDFSQQIVYNECPNVNNSYTHVASLSGSPQFFVMTGVLSLIYASGTLVIYLLFSSTYDSLPVMPVADLIVTGILCLFWFIASSSFASGVTTLKSTASYTNIQQSLCPAQFTSQGGICSEADIPTWKSLNVGLVSGFTSFFLWFAGLWFVYKETHFHTPRDQFDTR